jgi:arginase
MRLVFLAGKAGSNALAGNLSGLFGMGLANENLEYPKFDVLALSKEDEGLQLKLAGILRQSCLIVGERSVEALIAFGSNFQNPGLVVFDAHLGLKDDSLFGHDSWLNKCIESKVFPANSIILVGTRSKTVAEQQALRRLGIKNYSMKEISWEGLHEVSDSVMSAARLFGALFISIDIDVLDPAFAPGASHHVPAGLTSRELLFFLQRLKLLKNVRSFEVVGMQDDSASGSLTCHLLFTILQELY